MARAALARSLMAAGRADAALAEATRAQEAARTTPNVLVKLSVTVAAGRIRGLSLPGSAPQAIAALEAAEKQAATLGLVPLRFEASLALAEVTAKSDRALGDARLVALEKDARAHGLGLLASRAAAARQSNRK